ncbi:MAG TPA: ABC transporter substrate-binding protein [Chloroflexota bacterium]|nr:ABC transporter substrate-binding protein [Chloroflexota bacterium]
MLERAGRAGGLWVALTLLAVACGAPAPSGPAAVGGGASSPAASAAPSVVRAAGAAEPTAATTTAASASYRPTPLSPPVALKAGLIGGTSDAGIYIALQQGYFEQEGLQVEPEIVPSTSVMMGALAAGQLDVLGPPSAASIFNAAGRQVSMRMVADKGSTPSPEWDFVSLMVRKDLVDSGQVQDYRDLKGLTATLAGQANAPEIELVKALERGGLSLADVNLTILSFPDMIAGFANRAVDVGVVIEPFVSSIEAQGTAVRWRGVSEFYGNHQVAAVVYGPSLVEERPEVGRRFMVAYLRGVRDYNDAFGPKRQGREAVIQALTTYTPIKDAAAYDRMRPADLDPDGTLALQSIRDDLAYYERTGSVREPVDLSQVVDTSFQEYALRQLGPYQR